MASELGNYPDLANLDTEVDYGLDGLNGLSEGLDRLKSFGHRLVYNKWTMAATLAGMGLMTGQQRLLASPIGAESGVAGPIWPIPDLGDSWLANMTEAVVNDPVDSIFGMMALGGTVGLVVGGLTIAQGWGQIVAPIRDGEGNVVGTNMLATGINIVNNGGRVVAREAAQYARLPLIFWSLFMLNRFADTTNIPEFAAVTQVVSALGWILLTAQAIEALNPFG